MGPAILGPNHCVLRPFHLDRACLSSLFPLLSLLLISEIALRTCRFELCIRPSNPLPTASTLCGTLPGPAECAKRLNNNDNSTNNNKDNDTNNADNNNNTDKEKSEQKMIKHDNTDDDNNN